MYKYICFFMSNVKPFLKWVGGKTLLIPQIENYFPENINEYDTYVEPFVGGGSMFLHIYNNYKNFKNIIINDLNPKLINTYKVIRDNIDDFLFEIKKLENIYLSLDDNNQKEYYYNIRNEFNSILLKEEEINIKLAAYFLFLNKTGFNGLYRVNKRGELNTAFGFNKTPSFYNEDNLRNISLILNNVSIHCSDYKNVLFPKNSKILVYMDPPYKEISKTANFSAYTTNTIGDDFHFELKKYCNVLNALDITFLQSNSYCEYNLKLYKNYLIHKLSALRKINSKGDKRGLIKEILISNIN